MKKLALALALLLAPSLALAQGGVFPPHTVWGNATGSNAAPKATAFSSFPFPVTSVFGRTGAVVAATNDYNFNQLAGSWTLAQGPTITADRVLGAITSGVPTQLTLPSCSTSTSVLQYTLGTGFGCATSTLGNVTSPTNVYVATGGADTGNCQSVGSPCATMTYALAQATTSLNSSGLTSSAGLSVQINLAAGSYAQSLFVSGPLPGAINTTPNPNGGLQAGQVLIVGAGSSTTTITGSASYCAVIAASWHSVIGISKVRLTGTAASCQSSLFAQLGGIINIYDDIEFGNASVEQIHIDDKISQVQGWCPYTVSGNAVRHLNSEGVFIFNAFCSVGTKQSFSLTGTTHSNTTVDGFGSTATLSAGMSVNGSNIPSGTTIVSVDSGTAITISQSATSSTTLSLSFLAPILITGTPTFSGSFVYADYGGHIQFNAATAFSGAANGYRYGALNNATIVSQSSASKSFFPGSSDGFLQYGGRYWPPAAPTINSCANAGIQSGSTDEAITVTFTGSNAGCTLNWGTTKRVAPTCTASSTTTGFTGISVTTTTVAIAGSFVDTQSLYVICKSVPYL